MATPSPARRHGRSRPRRASQAEVHGQADSNRSPLRVDTLAVDPHDVGERLDVFVASRLSDLSRSQVQRLIASGHIVVTPGGGRGSLRMAANMSVRVEVPPPAPATPQAESLPLVVLYEDASIVVINKPAGMVVHPAAGHRHGTLVNALLHHVRGLSGIGGQERPGIVHRLDRGTSGVMVVAKHDRAHQRLSDQFRDRLVDKEYLALVWGAPLAGTSIDRPIGRDSRERRRMSTRARRARTALTRVLDIERLGDVSLVRVKIGTGRTHQIRVHLSEAHHPVVGDELYGGLRKRLPARLSAVARLDRPFLHAARLAFTHPVTGQRLSFEAPLPSDLDDIVSTLRRASASETRIAAEDLEEMTAGGRGQP